MIPKSLHFHCA